ncbi:MAG: phosphotransferase [Candidatus Woesearchaeota archaeon]|jgi:Ser/Thr protein kinase RdoA (MazF antagonist)
MTVKSVDRLAYSGTLDGVLKRACSTYDVGILKTANIVKVGYEDCNVVLDTISGKYVAKIFSKERTSEQITRYVNIMNAVVSAGINHPELVKTKEGTLVFSDEKTHLSMVVMKFIEGNTFFEMNRTPTKKELMAVLEQAAKINKIKIEPVFLFDSWAIPNINHTYQRVKRFMNVDDKVMVEKVINKYNELPVDKLPRCFVHGDFTKANVLKGNDGKIYILDFSVSNIYPRIQELAIIVANLMHDDKLSLEKKCELVAKEYNKINKLSIQEHKLLYSYALAGVAMEFIGANQEKYLKNNNSPETNYWLNLGRNGLQKELK